MNATLAVVPAVLGRPVWVFGHLSGKRPKENVYTQEKETQNQGRKCITKRKVNFLENDQKLSFRRIRAIMGDYDESDFCSINLELCVPGILISRPQLHLSLT